MKICLYFMVLAGLVNCNNNDEPEAINLDVETYVSLLKANQYDAMTLPSFTYKDIPSLLRYSDETEVISDFPRNTVSSLYGPDCTLGMYVLWTIESIRAVSVKSDYLVMRFPSLNPVLTLKELETFEIVLDKDSQTTIAKAYREWWINHENQNFDDFKHINPLEGTVYKWH